MHYAVMEYRMTVMKMIRNDDDSRYSLENNEKKEKFFFCEINKTKHHAREKGK